MKNSASRGVSINMWHHLLHKKTNFQKQLIWLTYKCREILSRFIHFFQQMKLTSKQDKQDEELNSEWEIIYINDNEKKINFEKYFLCCEKIFEKQLSSWKGKKRDSKFRSINFKSELTLTYKSSCSKAKKMEKNERKIFWKSIWSNVIWKC